MQPKELAEKAVNAINGRTMMTLVLPRPWKGRPKGFPRGELLCEQKSSNVYSFDPEKILLFLAANNLVKLASKET